MQILLGNQVTSKPCEHKILYLALAPFADSYHFRDLTKMIIDLDMLSVTGISRPLNGYLKLLPPDIDIFVLKISIKDVKKRTIFPSR